jgi:hypothetical protein
MIAILILGVAIVGLTQGVTTALQSGKESELQTTAAMFAAAKIEMLRVDMGLKNEETEGSCGDSLPLYRWKQSITATDLDGLHEVYVLVEHAQTGRAIYELRTFLFERPEDSAPPPGSRKEPQRGGAGRQ